MSTKQCPIRCNGDRSVYFSSELTRRDSSRKKNRIPAERDEMPSEWKREGTSAESRMHDSPQPQPLVPSADGVPRLRRVVRGSPAVRVAERPVAVGQMRTLRRARIASGSAIHSSERSPLGYSSARGTVRKQTPLGAGRAGSQLWSSRDECGTRIPSFAPDLSLWASDTVTCHSICL
jgi:hypothetical protein